MSSKQLKERRASLPAIGNKLARIASLSFSHLAAMAITRYILRWKKQVCTPGIEASMQDAVMTWSLVRYWVLVLDEVRMKAYQNAIKHKVRGKVVLEIGTGALAPLARMAVSSGAKKVYAIEANKDAAVFAKEMIRKYGLEDRIEVLNGFSQNIRLAEKAEVLIHEIIGYMGSDEGMASAVKDAKDRLLKPGATIIPFRCKVLCAPVPAIDSNAKSLTVRLYEKVFYNVEKRNNRYHVWNYKRERMLCDPQLYEDMNFGGDVGLKDEFTLKYEVKKSGVFGGFLFWNFVEVDETNKIDCFDGTTWGCVYIPFDNGENKVVSGDELILSCFRDLSESPKYGFSAKLKRGRVTEDFGEKKICW